NVLHRPSLNSPFSPLIIPPPPLLFRRRIVGLESRDYVRDGSYTSTLAGWGMEPFTPVVKYLIIVNVIVFLLQIFVTRTTQPEAEQSKESLQDWQNEMQLKAREVQKASDAVIDARAAVKQAKGDAAETEKLKADLAQKEAHLKQVQKEFQKTNEEIV